MIETYKIKLLMSESIWSNGFPTFFQTTFHFTKSSQSSDEAKINFES